MEDGSGFLLYSSYRSQLTPIKSVNSDWIVAQNTPQFGNGYPSPNCGKSITISYNAITAVATIADACPSCDYGSLDLSRGLFDHFAVSPDRPMARGTFAVML